MGALDWASGGVSQQEKSMPRNTTTPTTKNQMSNNHGESVPLTLGERTLTEIRNVSKDIDAQLAPLRAERQSRSREFTGAHRRSVEDLKNLGRNLRAQPSVVPDLGSAPVDLRLSANASKVVPTL